jgi:hypothetical protein
MVRLFIIFFLFLIQAVSSEINAQTGEKYRITFRDKSNNKYKIDRPEQFLSKRSLERRNRQNISIDETDLPVSDYYLDSLAKLGITVINISKWFNSAVVKSVTPGFPDILDKLGFITKKEKVYSISFQKSMIQKFHIDILESDATVMSDYGMAKEQIYLSNGQFLHQKKFRGEGMLIAVIDAGFYKADELPAFETMWNESRIMGIRNFVDDETPIFRAHAHGMYVLSIIGGNIPGQLVGTAPKASFWLIRSEDTSSEFPIEEDNWVAAAELADSVGADVINSSLGYYEFDDPAMNHTYADMDGKTTRVSKGAEMAASKGIFVSASAGNEGTNNWHYIIAPSDAKNILGVGAVDSLDRKAYFSSFGPSSDGRVKPDITAMGYADAFQNTNGTIARGSGTSFSSPVLAGLAACLWQAFPEISNQDLIKAIIKSGRNYQTPDDGIGYGTADFLFAYYYLQSQSPAGNNKQMSVFPNPFTNKLTIIIPEIVNSTLEIKLLNSTGQIVKQQEVQGTGSDIEMIILSELENLNQGTFIIKADTGGKIYLAKVIKL